MLNPLPVDKLIVTIFWKFNRTNKMNSDIKQAMYEQKRKTDREKIKPGNSKTLWEATNIAMDNYFVCLNTRKGSKRTNSNDVKCLC